MPKPTIQRAQDTEVTTATSLEKRRVQASDACAHGELGALLRREMLYHHQTRWGE